MAKPEKTFFLKWKGETNPNVLPSTNSSSRRGTFETVQVLFQNVYRKIAAEYAPILLPDSHRAKMETFQRGDFEGPTRNLFKNHVMQSFSYTKIINSPVLTSPNSRRAGNENSHRDTILSKLTPESSIVSTNSQRVEKKKILRKRRGSPAPLANQHRTKLNLNKLEVLRESLNKAQIVTTKFDEKTKVPEVKSSLVSAASLMIVLNKQMSVNIDCYERNHWPIRESLFPNIPPYIKFVTQDQKPNKLPPVGKLHLKWQQRTNMPPLIKRTLAKTGFQFTDLFSSEENGWMGSWDSSKAPKYGLLRDQKVNHFPGNHNLCRKDCLWINLHRLMAKYGTKEFSIIPRTYVLPQDLKALKKNWMATDGKTRDKWIMKPPASARGVGVKVINEWWQLPKNTPMIVQRYIEKPFLIKGNKFDLRLYVLVTSFDPLRIYIYSQGLVRFACVKYTACDSNINDRCMHLTNWCVNRQSNQYTDNNDPNSFKGHMWTLSKLWEYMRKLGHNPGATWTEVKQLVIKTIISGESAIVKECAENKLIRYNCYEIFGFDVIFDGNLKPWLLEVNNFPSWRIDSAVMRHVKIPLVRTFLDIAQFQLPPQFSKERNVPPCYDSRLYATKLLDRETQKQKKYRKVIERKDYLDRILKHLTGDDVRILTQAEDELVVKGDFEKIFPTSKTYKYLDFMPTRYYNRLCDAWECKYEDNRQKGIDRLRKLCAEKLHLQVPLQWMPSKDSPRPVQMPKQTQTTSPVESPASGDNPKINGKKTKVKEKKTTKFEVVEGEILTIKINGKKTKVKEKKTPQFQVVEGETLTIR